MSSHGSCELLSAFVQQPVGRALERNESLIHEWKGSRWPEIKKAAEEGRTIVFAELPSWNFYFRILEDAIKSEQMVVLQLAVLKQT